MITVICYISLECFTQNWNGWLLVLPVLLDLAIVGKALKEE